jgi:DNA-binding NtrC family response regulator
MRKDSRILRVLVVDDEPLILWGISKFLEKKSMVKTVATAEEALDEIRTKHYDLCFLDVVLPDMTGLDVMKIIYEQSPETKVAIMSGSSLNEDSKQEIEEYAYTFIEKPFDLSDIMEVIDKATAGLNGEESYFS